MTAQKLRDAAEVLRWRASFATPGPWGAFRRGDPEGPFGVTAEGLGDIGVDIFDGTPRKADATYVASMHPGVALALADWLDAAHHHVASRDCEAHCEYPGGCDLTKAALAVADQILGDQS